MNCRCTGDYQLKGKKGTSLGLMKNRRRAWLLSELQVARQEARNNNLLILTKTNSVSRVHRPAYIDYVGVKRFDSIGGETVSGLFSRASTTTPLMFRY